MTNLQLDLYLATLSGPVYCGFTSELFFKSIIYHRSLYFSEGINRDGMVVRLFTLCNLDKWFENLFCVFLRPSTFVVHS